MPTPGSAAKFETAPKFIFFYFIALCLRRTLDWIFGYNPTFRLYSTITILITGIIIAIIEAQAMPDAKSLPFPGKVVGGKHETEYLSM